MTLRESCIEAMAKADWSENVNWDDLNADDRAMSIQGATAHLDALLDTLTEGVVEWEESVHVRRREWAAEAWAERNPDHDGFESFALSLLSVLRLPVEAE